MRRIEIALVALVVALLAPLARAGLHTFHWVRDPGPYTAGKVVEHGTLTLNVPGRAAGESFGPADSPAIVDLWFAEVHEEFHCTSRVPLVASSDGANLDASSATLRLTCETRRGELWEVELGLERRPTSDRVGTPTTTWSGHWQAGNNGADGSVRASFVHVARPDNTLGLYSFLSHPLLDRQPQARFVISKNWNPGGATGTYDPNEVALVYHEAREQWAIVRADAGVFVPGSSFNVLIPWPDGRIFRHVTQSSNVDGASTWLSSPMTDDNPDAELIVTRVADVFGVGTGLHHPIGVWYQAFRRTWHVFNQDRSPMTLWSRFNVYVVPERSRHFVHRAESANIHGHISRLGNPLLDARALALIQFTQNWNPGGSGSIYNAHPVGIYRSGSAWSLFNQDLADMPPGAAFNLFDPPHQAAFRIARSYLGSDPFAHVSLPLVKHHPDALVLATQNLSASGTALNTREVGVRTSYYRVQSVANLDGSPMPNGAAINVFALPLDLSTFLHVTHAGNVSENWTRLDHPLLDGRPGALVFAIPHDNPHSVATTALQTTTGVWYYDGHWNVFAQDRSPMPTGTAFNVHVASPGETAFVHRVNAGNAAGSRSFLDHPELNARPGARLIITQNWNPVGSPGVYNPHPVGVRWDGASGRWQIAALDGADLPMGAAFNVLVPAPVCPDADFDGTCDADDRCPHFAAGYNLADVDQDGRGDECECGDANSDGLLSVSDVVAINEMIFGRRAVAELCDANADGLCNVADIVAVNRGIFGAELYCARHPQD